MSDSPASMPAAMTFGQILDRVFRLLQTQFRLLVGIAAVPAGAVLAICGIVLGACMASNAFPLRGGDHDVRKFLAIVLPANLLATLALTAVYAVYWAAASYAALGADRGLPVSFRTSYGFASKRAKDFLWLVVLFFLYVAMPFLGLGLVAAVCVGLVYELGGVSTGSLGLFLLTPLGILLYGGCLVYAILMTLRLSLTFPIAVEEGLRGRAALRRSAELTRGAKGRIFLALLVIYAASYLVFLVLLAAVVALLAVTILMGAVLHVPLASPLAWIGMALGGAAAVAAMFLFLAICHAGYATVLAVLYNDQRRREQPAPVAPELPA